MFLLISLFMQTLFAAFHYINLDFTTSLNKMTQSEKDNQMEMIRREKKIENKASETEELPVTHEPIRLLTMIMKRAREVVALIVLIIVLLLTIYGMVYNLTKMGKPTDVFEDSFKVLNALAQLQAAHGAFAIPNIGAIIGNETWNETSF